MKTFVESLQSKIEEGKRKLASLEDSADDDWEPLKGSVESWWNVTKSAFGDAKDKFKD